MSSSSTTNGAEALRRSRILSSKLYFDVPLSKVSLIYSESYNITFLGIEKLHPFDSSKWGHICPLLISFGMLDKNCIVELLEASKDDLLVVPPLTLFPNCPLQHKVLFPFRKQAAKLTKDKGWAINIGGGFHHCSAEKGGRFCAVMIIDLDAHQGNGHEIDFANDSIVQNFSLPGNHATDNINLLIRDAVKDYEARRYVNQVVEVKSGTHTEDYLQKLDKALRGMHGFDPELIVYNAGTDILDGDPLGRLKISPEGIALRDERVFRFACEKKVPIVMLTSGGYMKSSARVIADSIVISRINF